MDKDQIKEKYQNSGLTTAMASALRLQLLNSMEDKVFLDSALSLEILAEKLNTDRYSLSQVINQEFNKNFYEFINDYRINECLARIDENPHQIDSISDLIYASGFNNKVSFYNAFKKRKSMTPVQYIKALNQ
ncbi:helix-turn-helix domain-containing protein [Flagellimonas marinaquae]|nr:helix-turn-helix domain-containing protein [Allomuricauda aquimarina]